MNVSKIFIILLVTLTFSFNATAATNLATNNVSVESEQVEGGPRVVIQAMTTITVEQSTATYLEITIVDSEGNSVIVSETEEVSIVISLEELDKGAYTVETVDGNGDYQEFSIVVE